MGRHRVPPLHLVGVSLLTAAVFAVCHKLVVCTLGGSKIGDFFPPNLPKVRGGRSLQFCYQPEYSTVTAAAIRTERCHNDG